MSNEVEFNEDSAQTIILEDFFTVTQGLFVIITDQIVDQMGYRCRVMGRKLDGVIAEAGAKDPLKAERMAMARALVEWEELQEMLKAEAAHAAEDD